MTIYEMRLIAVAGLLAIGALALLVAFVGAHLHGVAQHLKKGTLQDGGVRDLTSERVPARHTGHLVDAGRLVGRRPAA
jgi:hypothetical protein